MKITRFIIAALLSFGYLGSFAQVFLNEGFEDGIKPFGWSDEYVTGTETWRFRNGGFNPLDPNGLIPPEGPDIARNPPAAYAGTYNAFFQKQGTGNEKTKLVAIPLDLEFAIKPELSFWLCQKTWTFSGQPKWDVLRVYYKTSLAGSWQLLQEYLDPIESWTKFTINLPNPSPTYYIAFEGHTRWGYGVCLDNVVVEEKGTSPRYVNELIFTQPNQSFVPSGAVSAPIMRISIKIIGNTGTPIFSNLTVKSLNTNDNDIATNGVKLYKTTLQTFSTANPISTPASFNAGNASFTNIGLELPSGYTYIWVTYDVKSTASHNNILDAMVEANSMFINDTLYPPTSQSPTGHRVIYETVYFQNFEELHGWDLTGEFQVATPTGLGGTPGNPDPSSAYSGLKNLGTDITGLGTFLGNYEPNITSVTPYTATSPAINLFFYKDIKLLFARYLNIDWLDKAIIEASGNDGVTWQTIWENSTYISDFNWNLQELSIPNSLARKANLKLRFKLGPTDAFQNYSGWNIDDVILTGDYVAKDVAVTEWVYPLSGCGHSATDSVIVKVSNLGGEPSPSSFPIAYSFNGGSTWVTENVNQVIPVGGTITYKFATKIDLSQPGLRPTVLAKTILVGDEEPTNDQISTQVYIVPTYTLPFTEQFELNNGYWRSFGTALWQHGKPVKTTINTATSGINAWVTSLSQKYGDVLAAGNTTIFEDTYEGNLNWSFTGEFERAIPSQSFLPYYAFQGAYCIGTDLSGLGTYPYEYENGITNETSYKATSPAINVSGYFDLKVSFQRYLVLMPDDSVKLEISPNNGITWYTLWKTGEEITDTWWTEQEVSIHDSLSYSTQTKFRFSLYYSSPSGIVAAGLNIDNFKVTGRLFSSSPSFVESPCINLPGSSSPIIDLQVFSRTEAGVDGASVYYSTNKGVTWNNMNNTTSHDAYWNWYSGHPVSALGVDGWSGLETGWKRARHILPAAVVNETCVNFRIGFAADKLNNNYDGIAIDDIKIYEAPYDFGITDIISPVSACDLSTSEAVTVTLKNFGITTVPAGEEIEIGVKADRSGDIQQFTENITLSAPLPVGGSVNIPLLGNLNMNTSGVYNVEAYTLSEVDPFFYSSTANDTAFSAVEVKKPFVELGPDIYTVHPDTIVFDVTNPNATSYLWQDNSTDPIFSVTSNSTATYSVTLSNAIPCDAYDEVLVVKLDVDIAISEIVSPISSCELTNETSLTIEVINLGTDTLLTNRPITLGYEFDGGGSVEVVYNLSETLYPDSVFNFTFAELFDMSEPRAYPIRVWVTTTDDETPANNEVSEIVTVYGYPLFNLTPDSIYLQANSYVVDAGAGYNEYFWHNDGSTEQTFTADSIGWVYATVSDINGCSTTDSIYIHLKYRDVIPFQIITPISSCGYENLVAPSFVIKNNGTDTLFFSTTVVNVGFQFEGGDWIEEQVVLTQDIYPNNTFTHTFSQTVDVTIMGDYSMIFSATTEDEMRPENDELNHNLSVFTLPSVNLSDDIVTQNEFWLLDAGIGFEEYLWNTDETTQTITVTESGTYSVTVTNNEICSDTDEVQVTFLHHDYGIINIVNPVSNCSNETLKTVLVRLSNLGNDTLPLGSTINFGYKLNQNTAVEQNYITNFKLFPGSSFLFTFSQQVNITDPDEYTIKAWAKNIADANNSNDTLVKTVNTYALPIVDLGPEDLWVTFPYILNSNVIDVTYLWNTGSSEPSITAEEVGKYWLRVTNSNSCVASDTIYLHDETLIDEIPGTSTMVSVYPNPSSNLVNIEIKTAKKSEVMLEVISSTGQFIEKRIIPVTNSVVHTIDASNYSSGIYLLRFTEGKKHTTIRLGVTH